MSDELRDESLMSHSDSLIPRVRHPVAGNPGVNVDPAAVTHPAAFSACLADAFDEVVAAG
jgi:hypothetical protein